MVDKAFREALLDLQWSVEPECITTILERLASPVDVADSLGVAMVGSQTLRDALLANLKKENLEKLGRQRIMNIRSEYKYGDNAMYRKLLESELERLDQLSCHREAKPKAMRTSAKS